MGPNPPPPNENKRDKKHTSDIKCTNDYNQNSLTKPLHAVTFDVC